MVNTGYKKWNTLEEYNLDTGEATGNTKPNNPNDPDYVAPVYDTASCPIPTAAPIFPKALTSSKGYTNIVIHWEVTDDVSIESQTVYYRKVGTTNYTSKEILSTDRAFYLGDLLEGTTYEFYVVACDGDSYCTESDPIKVRTNMRLTSITLSRSYNSTSPCIGTSVICYVDGTTLSNSTMLYNSSTGSSTAPPGYYSDGTYYNYWTGSKWSLPTQYCGMAGMI